jgi:NADH-quinone oxidoreductase subunit C
MRSDAVEALVRMDVADEATASVGVVVPRGAWRTIADEMRAAGAHFFDLTAIDRGEGVELVLTLVDTPTTQISLRTECPNDDLTADSLASVFPPAEWAEREVFDMFGLEFTGNPDMTRILQPDDATIFPLRRSFALEERPW